MEIKFVVNDKSVIVEVDPDMPLLWVIRDELGLKATKYGCGKALCGACTLHIDGEAIRSCSFPIQYAADKKITTLEGLSTNQEVLHPIQQAWIDENVPQCGYCQPGFMMAAAKFIDTNTNPTEEEIKSGITNICRCGTHPRIIKAIKRAVSIRHSTQAKDKI